MEETSGGNLPGTGEQPAGTQQVQPGGAGGQTSPEFITVAQAREMVQNAIANLQRLEQGQRDKAESRIVRQVQARLDELNRSVQDAAKAGKVVPEQVRKQAEERIWSEELAKGSEESAKYTDPNFVLGEIQKLNQAYGTTVEWDYINQRGDPEVKLVDFTSPESFLRTLPTALQAKAARLGLPAPKGGQQAADQQGKKDSRQLSPALTSGGGRPNAIETINDPIRLIEMGLSGG